MVLPEIILDIEFVGKNNMASISARFSYKLTSFSTEWMQSIILVSTIGVSGMPDIVVRLENTLAIALCVKSKMATICENQKLI